MNLRIKTCGHTRQEDLEHSARLGVEFCGFIFHPLSPRYVNTAQAANLHSYGMKRVGVFVQQSASEILEIMSEAKLDYAQLHGDYTISDAEVIGTDRIIRVFFPERYSSLDDLQVELNTWAHHCSLMLLDAGTAGGGSGRNLAWEDLSQLYFPIEWFLAGGLNPQNILQASQLARPSGVDLNSGIETAPGQKSTTKLTTIMNTIKSKKGYFGNFGGVFVPELLMPPLVELEEAMSRYLPDKQFQDELQDLLTNYAGRETPLTFCPNLSKDLGFNLWLKREDLLHTGAHKINNALGQALLARYMGKTHLVAETGAGQHGVATATASARLGLKCTIFMGAEDVERQSTNVRRMKLLGTEVHAVESGSRTLKDAINEALRFWMSHQENTHYCFGTAAGPAPFPLLVREFQSVIGKEARAQMLARAGTLPDIVVACVGGGSNAIGMLHPFVEDTSVRLIGVEAGGTGEVGCLNSAPLNYGRVGVLHGQRTMLLQDDDGQIMASSSISAGLDYPGVGPEHAHLAEIGRVKYDVICDAEALSALYRLTLREGILPAMESSHALAWAFEHRDSIAPCSNVLVNLSGRGDKDLDIIQQYSIQQ